MRPEANNPLDLNNLPEEYHGKQPVEESSTTTAASAENSIKGLKKKKNEGKDESGKVYECRFCSLKFCKSQALGGHMNRHRQERETETLNRACQLVFNNDSNIAGVGTHMRLSDLSYGGAAATSGCFQQIGTIMGVDPRLHFRPTAATTASAIYPRHPSVPQSHQHLQQPYLNSSSTRPQPYQTTYPAPVPAPPPPHMSTDYYIGRAVPSNSSQQVLNCTCFGPPPPSAFPSDGARRRTTGENWNCSFRFGHNTDSS